MEFVRLAWGVTIPNVQVCPNHSTPWRAFADAYFARSPVAVWHGSRGFAGKSFLLATLGLTEAVTLGVNVNVLGGSGDQSKRVLDHMQDRWSFYSSPSAMLEGEARTETRLTNGATIEALMASRASVRGPHPARLRLDECLAGDTLVATPIGNIEILSLFVGDVVYSVCGNHIRTNRITKITTRGIRETVVIKTSVGSLRATPEHPILTKGGWKRAEEISPDDTLLGLRKAHPLRQNAHPEKVHEDALLVEGIRVHFVKSDRPTQVYDISVERDHNFIANGIVSHNCDEMQLSILDAAMGQPMEQNGVKAQTVMSSTHQYADGTMTEILKRAAEKRWPVHEWCWRESLQPHGWLSQASVDQKKGEVTAAMWSTEYDLQEPSPESRAIQPEAVEEMFDKSLGEFTGNPHEYIEIEEPIKGVNYATGADWARSKNWTIITTMRTDVSPKRVVAWERTGRLDWPVMIKRYTDRRARYPGSGLHDTTGIGDVVQSYVSEAGVTLTGQVRADLLTEYIAAIERREIKSPLIHYCYSEHRYASSEDVYAGGSTHHLPDSICAGALAWKAGNAGFWSRGPGK